MRTVNLGFETEEAEGGLTQVVLVLPLFLHCEALSCWQCLDMAGEGDGGGKEEERR